MRTDTNITQPSISQEELTTLIRANAEEVRVKARQLFLTPGDFPNGVFYIASGRTRHYMVSMEGDERTLYTLSAGWFFGETPCTLAEPTGLFSMAEVDSLLLKIPLPTYNRLIEENRDFRESILNSYSRKILILRHEIENLAFNSLKDRLIRVYCSAADTSRLIDGAWYGLRINYTQQDLSAIVDGARVTISRTNSELCQEGVIRILNRHIQISAKTVERMNQWIC